MKTIRIAVTIPAIVVLGFYWCGTLATAQDIHSPLAGHNQGNIQLTVTPGGWGSLLWNGTEMLPYVDPLTQDTIYGCVYPRGSGNQFIDGFIFATAVVGSDTLSSYFGIRIDSSTHNAIWKIRSADISHPFYSPDARSELDLTCAFYDTVAFNLPDQGGLWDELRHTPTGAYVTQRSMAWSGALVDDFVLMEFEVRNMNSRPLRECYVAFWCDDIGGDVYLAPDGEHLTGFLRDYSFPQQCDQLDTINVAYSMDNWTLDTPGSPGIRRTIRIGDPVGGERRKNPGVPLIHFSHGQAVIANCTT